VQGLYRRAAVYWHAAGYGVDGNVEPAALEHFGMATAEAMAHGTVPVAIARGGQPEVVRHGEDGFLWREPDELEAFTWLLVRDPVVARRLAKAARASSLRYSGERFADAIVAHLRTAVEESLSG
jgi:glycosyltransferase involved in cell wall biosynthesis